MVDFNILDDNVQTEDTVDLILQQIDMLLDTTEGDVMGCPNYGCDFYKYIWDLSIPTSMIEEYATSLLDSNVEFFGIEHECKVYLIHGELNDIIMLEVNIYYNDNEYQKIYRID